MTLARSITTATAGFLACLPLLSACGQGNGDALPPASAPPSSSSAATTAPAGTEPTAPPDNWESRFSNDQLTAAYGAMTARENWNRLAFGIYHQGKLTPAAKATLQKYDFWWQRDIVTLGETYQKGGLREAAPLKVLWTYAKSVKLDKGGQAGTVVLVECNDYRPLRYTREGKPQKIKKPKHLVTPLLVTMTKPDADHGWMVDKAQLKDRTSCSGA